MNYSISLSNFDKYQVCYWQNVGDFLFSFHFQCNFHYHLIFYSIFTDKETNNIYTHTHSHIQINWLMIKFQLPRLYFWMGISHVWQSSLILISNSIKMKWYESHSLWLTIVSHLIHTMCITQCLHRWMTTMIQRFCLNSIPCLLLITCIARIIRITSALRVRVISGLINHF